MDQSDKPDSKDTFPLPSDGGRDTVIKIINSHVSCSVISIPGFIGRKLKGVVPDDYRTSRGIDIASSEAALEYCTPDEIERVAGARSLKRQLEWLCGRIALKELLRAELFPASGFKDIIIKYRETGKPFIAGNENISITLSHSGDYAMAAVHKINGKRIGLDIEKISGIDTDAVLSVAFSKDERDIYSTLPVEKLIEAFTVKEAYLKLTGQGFNEVIPRVSYINGKILFDGKEVNGITKESFTCGSEYMVTVIFDIC